MLQSQSFTMHQSQKEAKTPVYKRQEIAVQIFYTDYIL